jgi:hypothetical protein
VYGYVDDRTRFWAEIDVPALAQSDRLLARSSPSSRTAGPSLSVWMPNLTSKVRSQIGVAQLVAFAGDAGDGVAETPAPEIPCAGETRRARKGRARLMMRRAPPADSHPTSDRGRRPYSDAARRTGAVDRATTCWCDTPTARVALERAGRPYRQQTIARVADDRRLASLPASASSPRSP